MSNSIVFGIGLAALVPVYTFFTLSRKLSIENSGAIAAAYGSISAVTFITTISFLELHNMEYGGYMVAVMALMEAPAIIVGVFLIRLYSRERDQRTVNYRKIIFHALTNGSVLMVLGSLVIGLLANESQAAGIAPFTTDIFKGFLAIFLLDMGITSGREIKVFFKKGWFPFLFAIVVPIINGVAIAYLSGFFLDSLGNRLLMSILAASASYIAVPEAMRMVVPKASPSLYVPMALAVTFPFNITLGMPLYLFIIKLSV